MNGPDRPYTQDELNARFALLKFSPEQPAWVSQNLYDRLAQEPALADLMDRLRVYGPIPEHEGFRGFDPNKDMPRDPDGLDEVDPFTFGLMAGRSGKPTMMLASAAYHARMGDGPDWMKDLWEAGVDFDRDVVIFDEVTDWPSDAPSLRQPLGGRLLAEELQKVAEPMDPEPRVKRYGPHPTDPYGRGARRRCR